MMYVGENKVSQVMCVACLRRWLSARPIPVRLDQLECPYCHKAGFTIETGEIFEATDFLNVLNESKEKQEQEEQKKSEQKVVPMKKEKTDEQDS